MHLQSRKYLSYWIKGAGSSIARPTNQGLGLSNWNILDARSVGIYHWWEYVSLGMIQLGPEEKSPTKMNARFTGFILDRVYAPDTYYHGHACLALQQRCAVGDEADFASAIGARNGSRNKIK